MPTLTAALPRAVRLGLFRIHVDNGLSVAAGLTLVGLGYGGTFGFAAAVAAGAGALCVSVVDQPDPLRRKPWILAGALPPTTLATLAATLFENTAGGLLAGAAVVGLWTGLVSVYGQRALGLGVATVLAFVFGLGAHAAGVREALQHSGLFLGGGITYAIYAEAAALVLDGRLRRLLLAETLRDLARFLRAKAMVYDPDVPPRRGIAALIEATADLADRLQTARDSLFLHSRSPAHFRQIEILIALLDAFEVSLSGDADVETLRASPRTALSRRIGAAILAMADDVEAMIPTAGGWVAAPTIRASGVEHEWLTREIADLIAATDGAGDAAAGDALAAFRSTVAKLGHAEAALVRLRRALDPRQPPTGASVTLDLAPFARRSRASLSMLKDQLTLRSSAARYAVRLACALTAGMALTLAMPHLVHGGWVLLTTALIMRANYSVTRRRRRDRLFGTLAGCVLALGLIDYAPPLLILTVIPATIGVSHAYATINYRITALSASVTALLLLHALAPATHPLFLERLIDTGVGAGLSWAFSFLLPTWARDSLPGALEALLDADAAYAAQALARNPPDQDYRLARKRALDTEVTLIRLARDLADEPGTSQARLEQFSALVGANYLLVADLASVQVLLRTRGEAVTSAADAWLAEARTSVAAALSDPDPGVRPTTALSRRSLARLGADDAMTALARRLAHVERGAARVRRLARETIR